MQRSSPNDQRPRRKDLRGQCYRALEKHAEGATSHQIAIDLDWSAVLASKYLGLLFFAGTVTRKRVNYQNKFPLYYEYKYWVKQLPIVAAPRTQWQPKRRIAERASAMAEPR